MVDVRVRGDIDIAAETARLADLPVNYELTAAPTVENGWTVDTYCLVLPPEAPGAPEPGGAYEVACGLLRSYAFADPAILRGHWADDAPLLGRTMLLEGRFLFLRFLLGVRVSTVIDEPAGAADMERSWGWCYRTLVGHLEAGEMCYRVVKQLDTGRVEFRIGRYLRSESIDNPIIRLGWLVFGRAMQVLFVRRSMTRMRRLVEAALAVC